MFKTAETLEAFYDAARSLAADLSEEAKRVEQREISGVMKVFAGDAKQQPAYVSGLLAMIRSIRLLQLRETKQPIGPKEAQSLLELKVRRGGTERLHVVQQTVSALLGVNVDAFQPERTGIDLRSTEGRRAEMDVDDFLVEANGSGVRDALRLILDFELQTPQLVLIEEPEVHLHPGLARSLQSYLRKKADAAQIFMTAHSTEFVDSALFENVYLVARGPDKTTTVERAAVDGGVRITAEIGLRPSSLFMHNQLVFVEGATDEDVLRILAPKAGADLFRAAVGFVHMGGVRNFAYFAAEATVNLLAARQIPLFFIIDRDERDDAEIQSMIARFGKNATLCVLERRELENYLLDADAVQALIHSKNGPLVDLATIREDLFAAADSLRAEVARLRAERVLLRPVILQSREASGTPTERIETAIRELEHRRGQLSAVTEAAEASVTDDRERALEIAPGSKILELVLAKYGCAFSKTKGDSGRLASSMGPGSVPEELRQILRRITTT